MARTPQRPARRGATQPAVPTRLPSTRERKPALAAVGVLLILGGALASGYLALQAGNRDQFLIVAADMDQGDPFSEDALDTVELPEGMNNVVPADDKEAVAGTFAAVPLKAGTILTPAMYSTAEGGRAGYVTLPLEVPAGSETAEASSGTPLQVLLTGDDAGARDGSVPVDLVNVVPADDGSGTSDSVTINVSVQAGPCAQAVAQASVDDTYVVGTSASVPSDSVQDCRPAATSAPSSAAPTGE